MTNMYYRFDEISDPYNDLKLLKEIMEKLQKDNHYVKWAIIILHNLLQEFMVLAIKGTSKLQVIKKQKWHNNLTHREILIPNNKKNYNQLDYFLELYKKIKKDMKHYVGNVQSISNDVIDTSMECLNEYRNLFIHSLQSSFSLNKNDFVECAKASLLVIQFLVNESGNLIQKSLPNEAEDINQLIFEINKIIDKI